MIALLLAPAASADPAFLDTLAAWSTRARDALSLEDVRPYRVTIAALDQHDYTVASEFGTLFGERDERGRPGVVEVVVGDPSLDSSRFASGSRGETGRKRVSFVLEDVSGALDRDLWLLTDASFKDAVQRHTLKRSALRQLPTPYPPDWSAAPAVVSVVRANFPPLDAEAIRALATAGSRAFADVGGLRTGRVDIMVNQAEYTLATSEGTRLVQPESAVFLYAWCDLVRPDGLSLSAERSWLAALPSGLPSAAELTRATTEMGERLKARAAAPVVPHYEGPVVFEDRAAAQLFAALLTDQLEGTPPEPKADTTWEELVRGGPRLGRRVLPAGWSVDDDPRSIPQGMAGAYAYDRQGVAARPVALVRDGVVRSLLMTRVPRKELTESNGRAQGEVATEWRARLSGWTVTPDHTLSPRAFARTVERVRRAAGVDRVLVVRSMGHGRRGELPRPQDAVWRSADGREEPVLALSFQETSRRTLKDIVAASGVGTVPYLAGWGRTDADDWGSGNPTVLTGPRQVLVDDLELVFPGSDRQADAWAMPPLDP